MTPGPTPRSTPGAPRPTSPLSMTVDAVDGDARAGRLHTARGVIETPCFMPVGTRGSVRTLSAVDLEALGVQVVLGNTYHLMLRPGTEAIAAVGGLHRFTSWSGHLLTDSGGFQVFSLAPEVDDDGVTFRSVYDGTTQRLTPETAVRVQEALGADIQMVLDVCAPLPSPPAVIERAVERTAAWAARARAAHQRADQALFGIVQGGTDAELRRQSAQRTVAIGFDGYGIGGLSVGESPDEMRAALGAAVGALPVDRPRYLMGVGDPAGLVDSVAQGVDLFDCVAPTRAARHGTILTAAGRLNLRNARYARDAGPLDPLCPCAVCARWSRAYLRHLLRTHEPTAPRLLTMHNVAWTLDLVARMRAAIRTGTFASMRADVAAVWS